MIPPSNGTTAPAKNITADASAARSSPNRSRDVTKSR
jgi:hypothetical protein